MGLGDGTSLAVGKLDQARASLPRVVPGESQLITDRGALLLVTVASADLRVELGREDSHTWLVAKTEGTTALHAVPSDADDLVRTIPARVVRVRPDSAGIARLGPLPPGDYGVCRGDESMGERIVLSGKETRLELPSGK